MSGGYDHAGAWGAGQHWKLHVQADLQGFGDSRELADGRVSPAGLQRGDHRLGDLHTVGELQLREPDLFTSRADALPHELRMHG